MRLQAGAANGDRKPKPVAGICWKSWQPVGWHCACSHGVCVGAAVGSTGGLRAGGVWVWDDLSLEGSVGRGSWRRGGEERVEAGGAKVRPSGSSCDPASGSTSSGLEEGTDGAVLGAFPSTRGGLSQ